jgi:hypothetical protein
MAVGVYKKFLVTASVLSSASLFLAGCYRLDITQVPLYDDIMVEQEYKVIDPRQAPAENPKNMPKSYKKPVFNNELMKPAYQQRAPLPADVRDAQGLMLPEEPAPSNPTLYSVPTSPDVQAIKQDATQNRQKMEQDLNNANTQQQQMFGTQPSAAPAPSVTPSAVPPLPTGAPPPTPPAFKPSGALNFPIFASLTEKKTLKSSASSGLVYHLELLNEEQEWPVPLPVPMPATEEPEWEPPVGMNGGEEGASMPSARTTAPEGSGMAAPLPPLPKSDAPDIVKQEETLPWQPAPPPVASNAPPIAPPTDMPKPLASRIPQPSADPFAPALSARSPDMIPPQTIPQTQEAAALPIIKPPGMESQIEGAIKMKPEGYVAKDNNPEPRDHLYEYIGLTGVPLQDTPDPRGFIDGPDEEVFGYIPPPKDTTFKPEPTHEFGTPEIPDGVGHSNVTAMNEVGYATDPDLFSEEPFLLNPFKYDNRPKVNHPDFTPKEIAKPRPKRREVGSRFNPAYRHQQPTIGGPEDSSYYGYSYFQNVYPAE